MLRFPLLVLLCCSPSIAFAQSWVGQAVIKSVSSPCSLAGFKIDDKFAARFRAPNVFPGITVYTLALFKPNNAQTYSVDGSLPLNQPGKAFGQLINKVHVPLSGKVTMAINLIDPLVITVATEFIHVKATIKNFQNIRNCVAVFDGSFVLRN